jgi:vancomycin resistance protein YoaR
VRADLTIDSSRVRQRQSSRRIVLRRVVALVGGIAVLAILVGLGFAGSRTTLATGTTVAGVDVGGLSENEAVQMLSRRAASVERVPITFTAGDRHFAFAASQLGVQADWRAGVRDAVARSDGFGPLRGFRRLRSMFFGAHVTPPVHAYQGAVDYMLLQITRSVDRHGVNAKVVRKGLGVGVVEGRTGRKLDRAAAAAVVLEALGSFDRGAPVALPVAAAAPAVSGADLAQAAEKARTALSAPIRLTYHATRWRVPRWRVAHLLALPSGGRADVSIGGRDAEKYLERLARAVGRKPQDARFQITAAGTVVIRPSEPGLQLDIPATAKMIAAAAFSAEQRTAGLVVRVAEPGRTTGQAKQMGITGVVSSYTTTYGGTPGRLNNVQVVAKLIDGALVKPGATFSFNGTTGERTAAKGFQEAPVIINGELKNGLGGGICQVSTTVFNAAFEAGVPITERTNHALYISHYPLGRDATVNYPDLDLRFTNDSKNWLLLRTFVGSGSLTVNLYGTPLHRTVKSVTAPLEVTGPVPVKETDDPALRKGKRVVDHVGSPPLQTSVERLVYDAGGKLLYDNTWHSSYVGDPSLVRVGTKKPPKKPAREKKSVTAPGDSTGATTPVPTTPTGASGAPVAPVVTTPTPALP